MRGRVCKRFVALVAASALVLAGCGSDDADEAADGGATTTAAGGGASTTAAKSDLKVGLAYDIGGRGDKSFNDSAARGLDKAKAELGIEVRELSAGTSETDAAKEERLRLLAEGGFNPVIAVGFAYSEPLGKVAKEFPNVRFAIVDDAVEGANITNLLFAEEQASYLVGAIAALKSTTNEVGFIGGVNVPLIQKFQAGYQAGARKVKPGVTVDAKYISQPPDFTGFNDPAKGESIADGQYDGGADVVYAAAGGSGTGTFRSAQKKGKLAIGVDSDQYQSADPAVRDRIITSALKNVDVAVYEFIRSVANGSVKAGKVTFDLKNGGVGYALSGGKVDDVKAQVDALKDQIVAGTITVPTTL